VLRLIVSIDLVAFKMHQEVINKYLLISSGDSLSTRQQLERNRNYHSLSVGEHDRHRFRVTSKQVGSHHQRQIRRRHFRRRLNTFFQEDLQEADHEQDDATVDRRQTLDDPHAFIRLSRGDAIVVQLVRNERVAQFAQPELQQRGEHVWVIHAIERIVPSVDSQLQVRDRITISRYAEDAFRLGSSERKDTVRKEGKDDWYLLVWIVAFLQTDNGVERFAKRRGIKRRVLFR
jgi:hypothetical protein